MSFEDDTKDDPKIILDKKLDGQNNLVEEFVPKIRWPDTIVQLFIHLGFVYGFYLVLTKAQYKTILWGK